MNYSPASFLRPNTFTSLKSFMLSNEPIPTRPLAGSGLALRCT